MVERTNFQAMAIKDGKRFEGGSLDPEHGKSCAGVGILSTEAVAIGGCAIYCLDLGGTTLAIAVIYGWAGASKGSTEAARTDDLLTIVQVEFTTLPLGPKMIAGDLDGTTEAFDTIITMIKEQG